MARPSKYQPKFHCDDLIRLSKQGKNLKQIAYVWEIHIDTIYEWARRYPEFSVAIKRGRAYCEAWYINLGQAAMLGQAQINGQKIVFNLGAYVWLTKNILKWSDKTEEKKIDATQPFSNLTDEELQAAIDQPEDE